MNIDAAEALIASLKAEIERLRANMRAAVSILQEGKPAKLRDINALLKLVAALEQEGG